MGAANSLRWHFGRPSHVPIFHGSDNKFPPYLLTHKKLCNKVAIIKKGQIIASGTMEELTHGASLEEVFLEVVDE